MATPINANTAKINNFGNNVQAKPQVFGANAKAKAKVFKTKAKKELNEFVKMATDPAFQQKAEQGFRSAIDTAYAKASALTNKAVEKMQKEGLETLRAPIDAMQNLNIRRLEIRKDMSSNSKALRNTANKLIGYHENVIKASEKASRVAGDKTHSIVRFVLTPIRMLATLLQIESAGAIIQNSVALAAGFVVRGLVMSIMQLGHVLPYAAAAAVAGGVIAGLAALAIKVSPLAAVGVAVALILVAQQAQIISLGKKVDDLSIALQKQNIHTNPESADRNRLSSILNFLAKNKGKVAVGAALATAGVAGYFYGGKIVEVAAPYVQTVANKVVDLFRSAPEQPTSLDISPILRQTPVGTSHPGYEIVG